MTHDQAIAPAKGIEIAISELDISIAIDSPPAVDAVRESRSSRRNENRPSPATIGLATMKARIATAGVSWENRPIGSKESQPDCGSAA